jgi:hypothetical protein
MKKMCAKCGGSMKKGGTVKKVKKMAQGGQMYGIPQTGTTNYSAPTMARGGMMKKYKTGGIEDPQPSKSKSALKSPTQQLAQMSRGDYRDLKKGAKREAKLNRISSGKQGERVDNLIRTGAGVVESAARISRAAADMKKEKKGGSVKKYQGGGTTKTRTGRDGKTITKTTRSKSFDTEPKIGYSMKERSVSNKEGDLLKSKTKTTFTGTPAGTNRRTVVSKWNLKKDPESQAKSRKGIIPVRAKKMAAGGSLKPVPPTKVGLSKLPTAVRNKMGFQKKGGPIKKK